MLFNFDFDITQKSIFSNKIFEFTLVYNDFCFQLTNVVFVCSGHKTAIIKLTTHIYRFTKEQKTFKFIIAVRAGIEISKMVISVFSH